MTHPIFVILRKECLSAQSKQVMIFNAIQKFVCRISDGRFLDNNNPAIWHRKGTDLVVNMADLFIVNIIKRLSVKIGVIFPKILEPRFIIGQNFPLRLPQLLMYSSLVILVHQHKVKLIILLIVPRDKVSIIIKRQGPIQFTHERSFIMVLFIHSVQKWVFAVLVSFFENVLKLQQWKSSVKFWVRKVFA